MLTEAQPRTDCARAPFIPDVPISFKDHFRMAVKRTELQESLDAMIVQATANGVPPENL